MTPGLGFAAGNAGPGGASALDEVMQVRRRTEAVFDRTLSTMFDAMDDLSRAERGLLALAETFSPSELSRLRGFQDIFQGLAADVEAKVSRSRQGAAQLERLMRAGGTRLDDLRRLTRTAALVALNAQVVTGTIRADGGALDGLARIMRQVLAQVAGLVTELASGIDQGRDDLRRAQEGAAALHSFAEREAVPAIHRFAQLIEARARDKTLSRSAALVSLRLKALQDRIRLVVTHLQVGDELRQRLEHVEAILREASQPDQASPMVLRRLAGRQLRSALADLHHALHEGRRCLRGLGRTAGAIPEAIATGGLSGTGAGGLEHLTEGAARIERAIDGLTRTGQALADASSDLSRTLSGVGQATRTAAEFERRMTVLGLNAILLSSRLGTEGRAMVEVAQQLRDIARSITEAIAELRTDTEGIAATAGGLDVPEDGALAGRLVSAATAAGQVSDFARTVREQLAEMGSLRASADIAETFWQAERDLEAFGEVAQRLEVLALGLDHPGTALLPLDPSAADAVSAIRRIYTMQSERDLHDELFPAPAPAVPRGDAAMRRAGASLIA